MSSVDAVVVGAGPNGLVAALTMARAGLSVEVLEAGDEPGGGCRTAELTLPGFRHDVCSAVHPLLLASPAFSDLDLAAHGVRLLTPTLAFAHPLDGGRAVCVGSNVGDAAASLGVDGRTYARTFGPLVRDIDQILPAFLGSMRSLPAHPIAAARFGLRGMGSAQHMARRFETEEARALVAGTAAHSMLPLTAPLSGVFPRLFTALAHRFGWPVVEGGTGVLVGALVAELSARGVRVQTGRFVKRLDELPPARAAVLDVTPRQLLDMTGDDMPRRYGNALGRYRYGPGVCKVDWALRGPVPWIAEGCREAVTIHVGGTFEEIARGEAAVNAGRHPEHPYCLVVQPSVVDRTRAPGGHHTLWAYCHVPNGSTEDMTERIERQIERFAPGFRDLVLARSTLTAVQEEEHNPSYVGGDINAGAATLRQMIFRPTVQWNPYRTALRGVYLCSASTPPGGGVHGMCGLGAASAVMKDLGCRMPRAGPMSGAPSYAWYRFRATRRAETSYLLTVVFLVAALGGLSMGAIAAARSTESSFTDYVAASHVPQLAVLDGVINPGLGLNSAYNPALLRKLSHLPHVAKVASEVELNMGPITSTNHPALTPTISSEASVGGLGLHRGPSHHALGPAARSPQGRRVRDGCRLRQGARLPPGPGGPHGLRHQHPALVG